jgi:hypothetical protein
MRSIKMLAVLGLLAATPASAWAHGGPYHGWRGPGRAAFVAPRVHPVFVPGYWVRRGPRPFWRAGVWVTPPQAGAAWVAPRWVREGNQWVWREGYWAQPAPAYGYGY